MPSYEVTRRENWIVEKAMTYEVEADNEFDAVEQVNADGDQMIPVHESDVDCYLDDVPDDLPLSWEKL